MKNNIFFIQFLCLLILSLVLSSCKKNLTTNLSSLDIQLIKVYDDTLAKADNESIRICAGKDRLYMTYGIANYINYVNGTINFDSAKTNLFVTNNSGVFIWKYSLPVNLDMGGLIELNDGDCLVLANNKGGVFTNFDAELLYLLRFNKNGQLEKTDSISAPANSSAYVAFKEQHLLQLPNGNILLYGSYSNYEGSVNQEYGFACEYNLNGTLNFKKSYHYPLVSNNISTRLVACVPTSDGGYLFAGDINDQESANQAYSKVFLMKTNEQGDTIWTKFFHQKLSPLCRNLTSSSDGNFYLSFISTIDARAISYIYKVNAYGDSITSTTMDVMNQNYVSVMLEKDGGIFALINSVPQAIPYYLAFNFYQINTTYIRLNAELKMTSTGTFQTSSNDLLTAACKTSDGKMACFGLVQSYRKGYYKPELIILN